MLPECNQVCFSMCYISPLTGAISALDGSIMLSLQELGPHRFECVHMHANTYVKDNDRNLEHSMTTSTRLQWTHQHDCQFWIKREGSVLPWNRAALKLPPHISSNSSCQKWNVGTNYRVDQVTRWSLVLTRGNVCRFRACVHSGSHWSTGLFWYSIASAQVQQISTSMDQPHDFKDIQMYT